ncbi:DUF2971 domain-containing protein [Enterococcus canintestini]|uniref:DUF2971 domain-containing protein n=1 Tax=Enterococcus canintestini TaxID=317010 RepID=UPI000BA1D8CB|nr:DUF2971 domain-containing protein [Enterococcus canintestini]
MEYLYHYTNVDTLKLIIENGTFRFNSLQNVDDLEEMETEDFGNLGRFCYVSCWTDEPRESIPMWKEYTSPKKGLRIKLPINIFEEVLDIGFSREQFMPQVVELFPVTYTKDSKLLRYSVYNEDENSSRLETKLIGKFKNIDWYYQSEWRYKLFAFPFGLYTMTANPQLMTDPQQILNILKTVPIPYNYFDIPFRKEYLNEMEILTSPIFDEESHQLLTTITNTLSNVKVEKSTQRWVR